ncbi:MAG: ABC transporter [Oscillospiraceae bacterium]|jgi:ABC-2 type transport system permease protein
MIAVFKRELRSYFTGITGYIFIAFVLFFVGIFAMFINFRNRVPYFEYVLGNMNFVYLIIIPIITMRTISEERRQKTDQLLYSLPINLSLVVWGKYLAMVAVLLIPTVIMCIYPVFLSFYGSVNLASAYGAIFGFFLLGAALIAVGLFLSSLTDNQIVAAVLSFGVTLLFFLMSPLASLVPSTSMGSFVGFTVLVVILGLIVYLMTRNSTAAAGSAVLLEGCLAAIYFIKPEILEGVFKNLLNSLSVFTRLDNFLNGMFDLTAVVYYLTIILLFVFFTLQSMDKRRWS